MVEAAQVVGSSQAPNPPMHGFPYDWAWERQDGRVFLSGPIATVEKTDPAFVEWAEDGRVPSSFPTDTDGVDSVVELQRVLTQYNLSATLPHYARTKTWEMRVGGATINGEFIPTDEGTLTLLNGLERLADKDPNGSFAFDDGSETGRILTAQEAIGLATAVGQWVQGTFTKRVTVLLAGIADGTLKSKVDVDKALAPPKAPRKSNAKTTS